MTGSVMYPMAQVMGSCVAWDGAEVARYGKSYQVIVDGRKGHIELVVQRPVLPERFRAN